MVRQVFKLKSVLTQNLGLFCHTLDRRKELLERGREGVISYFLPLAFLVLVLWESWRSWAGSFPEFVDGKLKAVNRHQSEKRVEDSGDSGFRLCCQLDMGLWLGNSHELPDVQVPQ